MVAVGNQPAAARNLISPFPVSPSGGKPGRAGSPHAGSTSHASKQRWHVPMPPAPPTRGAKPPLCIPPVDTTSFRLTTTGLLMEAATVRHLSYAVKRLNPESLAKPAQDSHCSCTSLGLRPFGEVDFGFGQAFVGAGGLVGARRRRACW